MADSPVPFSTFDAHIQRLDQADHNNVLRLEGHIADYRREQAEMKTTVGAMDSKIDQVLENQNRWKGRDGVVLVFIGIFVSVLTAVITASILGAIR